jgi:hypothetical protein
MKTLRKLSSVIVLTLVLGLPGFAGQVETPPCPMPEPGQVETPPCQGTAPDDMSGLSNSPTAMAANSTLTEIATDALESMLSIF